MGVGWPLVRAHNLLAFNTSEHENIALNMFQYETRNSLHKTSSITHAGEQKLYVDFILCCKIHLQRTEIVSETTNVMQSEGVILNHMINSILCC